MMVRDNRLELLAPAKNLAFGIEAIKHGADAVYIGGPAFGARAAAGNSVADIEQLAAFAHRYGAQVFVALNTILKDSELAQAEVLAHQIWNAGADALIVQDLGLLQCDLPPIALHASTQLDNRTPEKVRFLQDVGFSQVVLARELSLEQIRAVSEQTSVQLEFFIHGALCVAYSGQCYISHALTGRSANRGECAQICRVPCSLKTREGETLVQDQHLLSLKDMNQTANLRAMIDAGIRSFKIEGRLKDLSYIKNVTAWYRQHLDEILEERPELSCSSAGRSQYSFVPNPDKTFNRGSTDYFLLGRQPTITSFRTPKYIGEEVGKVTRVGPNWFEVSGEKEFNNGDGLCYFNARQVVNGLRVNRADGRRLFTAEPVRGLTVNTVLYRNRDQVFDGTLEKESATRQIGVTQHFSETTDGFLLQMTDEQGFSVSIPLVAEKSPANNPERAFQSIREQLAKLGNTLFYSQHIDVTLEQAWFIPVSALNALRRQAVEALEAARINGYPRPLRHQAVGNPAFPQENLSYLGNVYNQAAENFYRMHGVDDIAPAYELNQEADEVSLMITKHCLRYTQNMCPKEVKGLKPDPLVLEMGNDIFRLKFDCKRCEMHVLGKLKSKVQRSAS
ncbi:U32 family peptidase [Plesiomonas shigelloides]|uniref:peptidase U32 family protein n=1 Tax=Plesiomonas shigelloides TaxID=703 RepID=UPI00387F1C9A